MHKELDHDLATKQQRVTYSNIQITQFPFFRNSSQGPREKPISSKVFHVLWQEAFWHYHILGMWSEGGGEERNWILS